MTDELKQELMNAGYTGKFDLTSLIEACGERFSSLHYEPPAWRVVGIGNRYSTFVVNGLTGVTPERAAGRLLLALLQEQKNK